MLEQCLFHLPGSNETMVKKLANLKKLAELKDENRGLNRSVSKMKEPLLLARHIQWAFLTWESQTQKP